MNVLVIAPVMSKDLCDDYFMYKRLHEKGINLVFITGQTSGARANHMKLSFYENIDGFPIYRLYKDYNEMTFFPRKKSKKNIENSRRIKPRYNSVSLG